MEQRRIHSQQHAHRPHDSPPFNMLQSPLYSAFPDVLGGDTRATQPPHPSPQYAQQHYAPDSDPPLAAQRPPQRSYGLQEHPQQGRPHLGNPVPSPALQQPQPLPAAASHPLIRQEHEGYNPVFQAPYHQLSCAPAHQPPQHLSIEAPWYFDAIAGNANAQPRPGITRLTDFTYAHPQQRYSFPMAHPSAVPPTPPELSPTTTVPDPSPIFHEQHDNGTNTDAGQRSRHCGGAGALDPTTGIYHKASDHPRIRTAQACEKCRARKAKVCYNIFFPVPHRFPYLTNALPMAISVLRRTPDMPAMPNAGTALRLCGRASYAGSQQAEARTAPTPRWPAISRGRGRTENSPPCLYHALCPTPGFAYV
jgi:hypothetical protein